MNIAQITNYDLAGSTSIQKTIEIYRGEEEGWVSESYTYKIYNFSHDIFKLGYCCEVKGISYPIFLTINGKETKFEIGKTGMFEFQPEEWYDINAEEPEERTAEVFATSIKVPDEIEFVLDFCY
jgi:hypothetical protein